MAMAWPQVCSEGSPRVLAETSGGLDGQTGEREQEVQAARGQVMKAWAGEADRPGFKSQPGPKCSPALGLCHPIPASTQAPQGPK